jgi:hypothetical protein
MTRGVSRVWFRAGAIGLLVVAGLHTMGHFSGGPDGPAGIALEAAMKAHHVEIMGMRPSTFGITQSLSLAMSILLLLAGAVDLSVLSAGDSLLLRRLAMLNVAGVAALVAVFAAYRISPPLVSLALVDGLFLMSLLRSPRRVE